jgi:hypothetical protein
MLLRTSMAARSGMDTLFGRLQKSPADPYECFVTENGYFSCAQDEKSPLLAIFSLD